MTRDNIITYLKANADIPYREFHSKLVPNVSTFIGVRVPLIRTLAKNVVKGDFESYLNDNKDAMSYYEEYMLYGMTLGSIAKPVDYLLPYIAAFVPQIDNWAVCDSFCASLKVTKKNKKAMLPFILEYLKSDREYELRFAIVMLMNYYIDDEHIDFLLSTFEGVKSDYYYVNMALAWALSFCYIHHCAKTLSFILNNNLNDWTHNKMIQKIVESRRVSTSDKELLKSLKR